MDVYGRNDTDSEYFRANIWSWPSILMASQLAWQEFGHKYGCKLTDEEVEMTDEENGELKVVAKALEGDELFQAMAWNDGRGCEDKAQCMALAGALRDLLKEHGIEFQKEWEEDNENVFLFEDGEFRKGTLTLVKQENPDPWQGKYEVTAILIEGKGKEPVSHIMNKDQNFAGPQYSHVPHLCEWIEFLEKVDGFSVW